MKFNLDQSEGFLIRSYSPEGVVIARRGGQEHQEFADEAPSPGETHTGSLILSPDRLITDCQIVDIEALRPEHLDPVMELEPELVILGSGATLCFPQPTVLARLSGAQIGVEVMDTGAACRTYNLLATEGRHVVAVLLIS